MPLASKLFAGDKALNACLVDDAAHILLGASGDKVAKIHTALLILDDLQVSPEELKAKVYGKTTAAAVLSYKTKRSIIARNRQSKADDIVGKMTIASMDRELVFIELGVGVERVDPSALVDP